MENKKDFVRKEWNIFNRIDENRMVFAVFGNRRGDVFEYQGTGTLNELGLDDIDDRKRCQDLLDRDRIIHSKAFRRLKDKTQVFLAAQGDHYRTRLTHTLEVSQTARTIAKALELNEDLVEAIALGHDLGHTPFGHAGEAALNEICPEGFAHFKQSVRGGTESDLGSKRRDVESPDIRHTAYPGRSGSPTV